MKICNHTILGAAAFAFLALGLSGCASTTTEELGRFTVISSKNVDLSRLGEMQRFPERTETKRFNTKVLFITHKISDSYVLENALDSALESIPGAVALVDAKISYYTKGGFSKKWGYKFEGTALVDSNILGSTELPAENDTLFIISDEDTSVISFVSETDFNAAIDGMILSKKDEEL